MLFSRGGKLKGAILLVLCCGTMASQRLPPLPLTLDLHNRTSSVEIVSSELSGDGPTVTLTLLNRSDQPITAISVSTGPGSYKSEEWGFLEGGEATDGIMPGDTYVYSFGYEIQDTHESYWVTLAAVVFLDESAEGDRLAVETLLARRFGGVLQSERIRSVLDDLLNRAAEKPESLDEAVLEEAVGTLRYLRARASDGSDSLLSDPSNSSGRSFRHIRYLKSSAARGAMASGMSIAAEDAEWKIDRLKYSLPNATDSAAIQKRDHVRQELAKIRDIYRTAARGRKE